LFGRRAVSPSRPAISHCAARSGGQGWPSGHRACAARSVLYGRKHGVTLDQVGGYCPAGSWFFPRSVVRRNVASGRSAPLCPERGHLERAATKDAGLPGLVPAGTCSRLDQADLGLRIRGVVAVIWRPLRHPNRNRGHLSKRGA
jgi:hypothetical protein